MTRLRACLLWLVLVGATAGQAEPLPAGSGIVNVRDYGARGDGQADDTAALLRAIAASGGDTGRSFWQDRIVYLPNGTYRVSDTLLKRYGDGRFGSGLILIGESRTGAIIRLNDAARGFGDPAHPKAVLFTSSRLLDGTPTSGGKDYTGKGEGNDAYMNTIEDLTIDVGARNPGAIAIDYLANNIGAIRHVSLRAARGSGLVGLSLTRKWPGPAMIRDLEVQGFATGIAAAQTEYGLTFEDVRLEGQTAASLRNDQNVLTFRNLDISGTPQAIANIGPKGMIAIDGGHIPGGDPSSFHNQGMIVLRDVVLGARRFSGSLSGPAWTPSEESVQAVTPAGMPLPPGAPPAQWVSVARFGAVADPSRDSTQAFRKAFASGARIIYLPHGTYAISDSLTVPAGVQRIAGFYSTIKVLAQRRPGFARNSGMLRVAAGTGPLWIERLTFDNTGRGQQLAVEASGGRALVLRDIVSAGVTLLDRKQDGGPAFLENTCCGRLRLAGPAPVYARQFDTEGAGTRITNAGSPLWILGLKTEGIATLVDNQPGARTTIFGGLVYMVREGMAVPAFVNHGGWISACFAEESLRPASHYNVYLLDRPGNGPPRSLAADIFPRRGLGHFVPDLTAARGVQ